MKSVTASIHQLLLCPPDHGYDAGDVTSRVVDTLIFDEGGIVDDRHHGRQLSAGARQLYVARETKLLNLRQVSIVSLEELAEIARILGVDEVTGADLGANIVLSGVQNLSTFPAGINGVITFGGSVVVLYATGENEPCEGPGRAISIRTGVDVTNKFAKAAMHRRGIVAVVGQAGVIDTSLKAVLHFPAWIDWQSDK